MTEEQVRAILPKGYPLSEESETEKYRPVWELAFQLHKNHPFTKEGPKYPRKGVVSPIPGHDHYCTCFERAYETIYPTKTYTWWRDYVLDKAANIGV